MTRELTFSVPLLPPSVNHYRKPRRGGGFFRAREAIGFVDAVCIFSRKEPVPGEFYEVEVSFYLPAKMFRRFSSNDTDNFLKVAIDALGQAGVISNDGRVLDLVVHKREAASESEVRTDYHVIGKDPHNEETDTTAAGASRSGARVEAAEAH